jgi:hypothetical protein
MGNLQPLITQTLLPGTKEAYGQLPLQDFNLLEQQMVTAYGQSKMKWKDSGRVVRVYVG